MNRIGIILVLIVIVAFMAGTGYFLYSKNQTPEITYETETPSVRDVVKKTVATGSVVPRKEVEIKPQVSGIINQLYVEPGDQVSRGDLIASIEIIPDMVNLNNAENRLRRAKIQLENAERDFKRNKALLDDGVIAEATFQQVELDYLSAQEELNAAQDNLDLIRKGTTKRSGANTNTNVRATISGMVLDIPVEEGNSVIEANTFNEGTSIAVVADMREMIFEGTVDESEVGKLKPGMDLLLIIGAIDDQRFEAVLEYIAPKGVEENGAVQFEIRAAVKLKEDQFIRANYSANADIVLERRDQVLTIPEAVLQFEGDSTFVEIAEGKGQYRKQPVQVGLSDGIHIEVLEGVESDAEIKNPNVQKD
jgi:HlyD family secretion protein